MRSRRAAGSYGNRARFFLIDSYDMRTINALLCMTVCLGPVGTQFAEAGSGPCAVLTKAEVQQAVGATVSEGVINPNNKSVCDFKVGESGSAVSILITSKSPLDSAERTVSELKKRKMTAEVLQGFVDSAYSSSPGYGMEQVGVYKGAKHVIVTVLVQGAPAAKSKVIAQALMRKALPRVP